MDAFTTLKAVAVPLDQANIDTDQIIPARFLKAPREQGYGAFLFHDARERADFFLNHPVFGKAKILVANTNFGCGSSREGAPYAFHDAGFRGIIAPSFGDIFFNNCFQNGALPIRLDAARVAAIRAALRAKPGSQITIDLANQTVTGPDGKTDRFEIDSFRKECLLKGVDEVNLTLSYEADIARFEQRQKGELSWL